MKCDICKKNQAIIHLEEQSNSGTRTINLCLECATEKGLNLDSDDVNNFLFSMLQNIFSELPRKSKRTQLNGFEQFELSCPACGKTMQAISDSGRIGCEICLSEFQKIIDIVLFKTNKSLDYKGRLPEELQQKKDYKYKIRSLKLKLAKAVNTENYEEAAKIRDMIKHYQSRKTDEGLITKIINN